MLSLVGYRIDWRLPNESSRSRWSSFIREKKREKLVEWRRRRRTIAKIGKYVIEKLSIRFLFFFFLFRIRMYIFGDWTVGGVLHLHQSPDAFDSLPSALSVYYTTSEAVTAKKCIKVCSRNSPKCISRKSIFIYFFHLYSVIWNRLGSCVHGDELKGRLVTLPTTVNRVSIGVKV